MSVQNKPPSPQRNTMLATKFGVEVEEQDPAHSQAHDRQTAAISELERIRAVRSTIAATLKAGANVVNHGLGRTPKGCNVTPTTADATFAYALTAADGRTATITTVGGTQTNCTVEFY
jgi:hypothetical protein